MKRVYLIVSIVLFGVTLAGGALLLSGMSGPHMGAAVFAGYLVVALAILGANFLVALALMLGRRARLAMFSLLAALALAWGGSRAWHRVSLAKKRAQLEAASQEESDWVETVLALPRDTLLAWLKDGTFDARRPPRLSPALGLWDCASRMAQACKLDAELLSAIDKRQPFGRDQSLNLLEDLRQCPSDQRQEWFAYFCRDPSFLGVKDAEQRWLLAQRLLALDVSGDYLRHFVASGFHLDAEAPGHPPLLFDVLGGDEAILARTRVLLQLGARRDVKNAEGLTPAAFFKRRAEREYADGDQPDEWRATQALLEAH